MRKTMIALLFVSLAAAPAVIAAQTGSSAAKPAKATHTETHATKAHSGGKSHPVSAEFVSYDPVSKKATVAGWLFLANGGDGWKTVPLTLQSPQ